MKTVIDGELVEESERFSLRFACEDCVHFAPAEVRCGHGYPPGPRRSELMVGGALSFCKEFELA